MLAAPPSIPWLQAVALLDHLIEESERPLARRAFRSIGPRCQATALRQMRLQRRRVLEEAALLQLGLNEADIAHAGRPLRLQDDLPEDFLVLAEAFQRLAQTAAIRANPRFRRWLEQRAQLHRRHSLLLQASG